MGLGREALERSSRALWWRPRPRPGVNTTCWIYSPHCWGLLLTSLEEQGGDAAGEGIDDGRLVWRVDVVLADVVAAVARGPCGKLRFQRLLIRGRF